MEGTELFMCENILLLPITSGVREQGDDLESKRVYNKHVLWRKSAGKGGSR